MDRGADEARSGVMASSAVTPAPVPSCKELHRVAASPLAAAARSPEASDEDLGRTLRALIALLPTSAPSSAKILAAELGVSASVFSRWLNGKTRPRPDDVERLLGLVARAGIIDGPSFASAPPALTIDKLTVLGPDHAKGEDARDRWLRRRSLQPHRPQNGEWSPYGEWWDWTGGGGHVRLELAPRYVGVAPVRIDFNPAKIGGAALAFVVDVIHSMRLVEVARVSRCDIAVDFGGVDVRSMMLVVPRAKIDVLDEVEAPNGFAVGARKSARHFRCYDQRFKWHHDRLASLRVEARAHARRPAQVALAGLAQLADPFAGVGLLHLVDGAPAGVDALVNEARRVGFARYWVRLGRGDRARLRRALAGSWSTIGTHPSDVFARDFPSAVAGLMARLSGEQP